MFIDRLFNSGNAPMLAQAMRFTQVRQDLLQDSVANATTPDYHQKDLSVKKFQAMLSEQLEEKEQSRGKLVDFEGVMPEINEVAGPLLYHDGNNRSMEQLMADSAKNGMMHNFVVELLRKQFGSIQDALRERVS